MRGLLRHAGRFRSPTEQFAPFLGCRFEGMRGATLRQAMRAAIGQNSTAGALDLVGLSRPVSRFINAPSTLGFRSSASPCFPCQVDVSRTPGWRVSECGFRSRTTRKMAKSCPRVVPSHLHHPEGQDAHSFARLCVRGRAPCVRSPSRGCSQPLQGFP